MTMSNAQTSHGTLLQRASAVYPNASGWVTVAEITSDIDIIFDKDMAEVTTHQSGGYKEYKGTLKSIQPITVDVNFGPQDDTHDFSVGAGQDWEDDSLYNYRAVLTDGTAYIFPCRTKTVGIKNAVNGVIKGTITLQPSGAPSTLN